VRHERDDVARTGPARPCRSGLSRPTCPGEAVVLLATFVINLDTTIVNVALPAISQQLHAGTSACSGSSTPSTWPSPD